MLANKQFLTGAQIVAQAAKDVGAKMMYGYPITPATDIFTAWIKNKMPYLQTEDEIAAGFGVCGAVLAGEKAFAATSGPGHILMQDAMSMAEGMRLPFVLVIAQRGGPSSGTVIYSQQEAMLACFGGNGEGHRIVYSPSCIEELYVLVRRAFNESWKYRFPAIVLTDGYLIKTKNIIDFSKIKVGANFDSYPLVKEDSNTHIQNIYTFEEDLNEVLQKTRADFNKIIKKVALAETAETEDANVMIVAHGIVGSSAKKAVENLRQSGIKAGLFRPVTLRPFPKEEMDKIIGSKKIKKVIVVESSYGQLARIVRDQLAPEIDVSFEYINRPGLGIGPEDITNAIKRTKI